MKITILGRVYENVEKIEFSNFENDSISIWMEMQDGSLEDDEIQLKEIDDVKICE